jgi:hypothetical protein
VAFLGPTAGFVVGGGFALDVQVNLSDVFRKARKVAQDAWDDLIDAVPFPTPEEYYRRMVVTAVLAWFPN